MNHSFCKVWILHSHSWSYHNFIILVRIYMAIPYQIIFILKIFVMQIAKGKEGNS